MEKLDKIRKSYIEYVLENGKAPASFFVFAKKLKMTESELYEFYTSFESIEMDVWLSFFEEAKATIEADETYNGYSVREKLLAFYYTWIEVLKANRSFAVYGYNKLKKPVLKHRPKELKPLKEAFYVFVNNLLMEGKESREIVSRPYADQRYADGIWANTLFIVDFWVKDTSKGFELTDTAIEKTVNAGMDVIGKSIVDSVFDLAKFVFQNK